MSQRGGTYHPQAVAAVPAPSDSSSRSQYQSEDDKDKTIEEGGDDTRTYGDLAPSGHTLTPRKASPEAHSQVHGENEDQDWEVVQHPGSETGENPFSSGCSCHFDMKLGWGRKKFTVFSWDMSVSKNVRDSSQSSPRTGQ
ncbi:hypothetical protein F4801DRAFT_324320 [Xylaria longipes]|nr:hypothetical protein F4801DRAFT_324320 [Xylaria longipes]